MKQINVKIVEKRDKGKGKDKSGLKTWSIRIKVQGNIFTWQETIHIYYQSFMQFSFQSYMAIVQDAVSKLNFFVLFSPHTIKSRINVESSMFTPKNTAHCVDSGRI